MKKLLTICLAVAMVFAVVNTVEATPCQWEVEDLGLGDIADFSKIWGDGSILGRSDIAEDPGTQFDISLISGVSTLQAISIGDNFDFPSSSLDSEFLCWIRSSYVWIWKESFKEVRFGQTVNR